MTFTHPFNKQLLAYNSIYAECAICYRPSVHLTITPVDQSKTVEVRIMQLSSQSNPMPLVFVV